MVKFLNFVVSEPDPTPSANNDRLLIIKKRSGRLLEISVISSFQLVNGSLYTTFPYIKKSVINAFFQFCQYFLLVIYEFQQYEFRLTEG